MKYISINDVKIISHYLGRIMQATGIAFLVPVIVAIFYREFNCLIGFIISSGISLVLGTLLNHINPKNLNIHLKHGMIISSIAWIWASFLGAIVMKIILHLPLLDGMFENTSTWTGTAFTLFTNIESLPHSILFLRSFEGWLGGLGIVIIGITILLRPGTSAAKIYKSEDKDERIKPSIIKTMHKTLEIYIVYTLIGIVLYILAGLPIFDAVNLCFSMICTGGMSIKNQNIGFYHNNIIYIISMVLMIMGAVSFPVHYKIMKTKGKALFRDVQFQTIIILIIASTLFILYLNKFISNEMLFTIIAAITTTGANCIDPNIMLSWKPGIIIILMILMVIGGSSGSTVGGIKIIRFITILKAIEKNVIEIVSPEGRIIKTKIKNKNISDKAIKESCIYFLIFIQLIIVSWIVLLSQGYDSCYSLFDIISAVSNNGLSLGMVNLSMPVVVKLTMIIDMLLGKLEIIPIIVLIRALFEFGKLNKSQKNKLKRIKAKL